MWHSVLGHGCGVTAGSWRERRYLIFLEQLARSDTMYLELSTDLALRFARYSVLIFLIVSDGKGKIFTINTTSLQNCNLNFSEGR